MESLAKGIVNSRSLQCGQAAKFAQGPCCVELVVLNPSRKLLLIAFLLLASPCFAQGQHRGTTHQIRKAWPAPVRNVSHEEQPHGELYPGDDVASQVEPQGFFGGSPMNGLRQTHAPHHVLQSPGRTSVPNQHGIGKKIEEKRAVHPPHSNYVRRFQPAPAVIPGAAEKGKWKTPYSYGYFGASGTRHWSMHHGHRDRYTEWRLK